MTRFMDGVFQDLRYSLRALRKSRGFVVVAVLVLALGIGVNTAIFSIVNAVLFRPLPVHAPEELAYLYWSPSPASPTGGMFGAFPARTFDYFTEHNEVFSALTGHMGFSGLVGIADERAMASGEIVATNYFDLLGVRPWRGRTFDKSDEGITTDPAIVVSHGFWMRRLSGDPEAVGKNLILDNRAFAIVGVVAPDFTGISDPWTPSQFWVSASQWTIGGVRRSFGLVPIGRLKPGISLAQARANAGALGEQVKQSQIEATPQSRQLIDDDVYSLFGANSVRLPSDPMGRIVPARLAGALMAIVGVVLLIALSNVAGLLMSRAVVRQGEIAVRRAIGASTGRIVRQVVTETMLLSAAAGALGLLLTVWLLSMFHAFTPEGFALDVRIDTRVLVYAVLACVGTGLVVGLAPARQLLKIDLLPALSGGGTMTTTPRRRLQWLVIPQIALLTILLVASGIYARDLAKIQSVELGYNPDNVVTLRVDLPELPGDTGYPVRNPAQAERFAERTRVFYQQLMAGIETLPNASNISLTTGLPLRGRVPWEGDPRVVTQETFNAGGRGDLTASTRRVSPGYFRVMGMTLRAGRDFDRGDGPSLPKVAVVSQALATRLWKGQNPIGRVFAYEPAPRQKPEWLEVVGVANDVNPILREWEPELVIYVPHSQQWRVDARTIVARVSGEPTATIQALRQAVAGADPVAAVTSVRTMTQLAGEILYPRRLAAAILAACAAIGFFMAGIGLYGVVSFSVAQRMREFGVRSVLGAQRADILTLVAREGLRVVVIGSVAGIPLVLAAGRAASAVLPLIPPVDAAVIIAVLLGLAGIVLGACYLPARRAASVDPVVALREL